MIVSTNQSQRGFTIIELLIVVFIFASLAAYAVPSLKGAFSEQRLESATATLMQSIQKAKKIAHAESAFVDVTISANTVSIQKRNDGTTQIITLPAQIDVEETVNFRFNTIGNVFVFDALGDPTPAVGNTPVALKSISSGIIRTVVVSNIGNVTSHYEQP